MVCRVYSCKVKDDATAHKMDVRAWTTAAIPCTIRYANLPSSLVRSFTLPHLCPQLAFEDFLDRAAEAEGCAGASRLVCKTAWDYKLILKFEF